MDLTDVSKTAIVTLRSYVIESQKKNPLLKDPMAQYCFNRLASISGKKKDQIFTRKLPSRLTSHIAIRARYYDSLANDYIAKHRGCTLINLGAGFDTRYWRLKEKNCTYIELDLPDMVEIKKKILGKKLDYEMVGCSVLDESWIDHVTENGNLNFLLIAEGLFMYLDKPDVKNLFGTFSKRFKDSQIVLEVVTEKYTRGLWKKIVEHKMRRALGLEAGSSYNFGIKKATELETYGKTIKVIKEWSFVDDPDTRPRIYRYMGISRTQWTVTAAIG